jgi:hypothetical protein
MTGRRVARRRGPHYRGAPRALRRSRSVASWLASYSRLLPAMPLRRLPCLAAAVLAVVTGPALASGNLGFLGRGPLAHFNETDIDQARGALGRALRAEQMDTAYDWANPATGAGGRITPLRVFERDGLPCRDLRIESRHPRASADGIFTLCQRDGRWRMVTPPR